MTRLADTVRQQFRSRRVVVLGDIVADQFLHGTISRVSREAPVFILNHEMTDTRAGGAANAAVNIAALGGNSVLVGFVGDDENGALLQNVLSDAGVDQRRVISDARLRTTTKVRVLAAEQHAPRRQVIRIDYAQNHPLDDELVAELRDNIMAVCEGADAVIVSDYNYGAAGPRIVADLRQRCADRGIPLLIDSRFRLPQFSGATAATPNQEEVEQILGNGFSTEDCEDLRLRLGYKALLVTRGNKGMTLFEEGKGPVDLDAVGSTEPVDVTGAGDTVIGVFALGLASGLTFGDAAMVANHAGGIVVMKHGTASVSTEELLASLESQPEDLSVATQP